MTSGPSTVVLVVAVLGLVLSTASLVWQAATYRLNGPRVRVELLVGAVSSYGGAGGMATAPVGPTWQRDLAALRQQGMAEPMVAVRARNIGRAPTTVTDVGATFDTGAAYTLAGGTPGSAPLPHRLEAEDSAVWWLPLGEVAGIVRGTAEVDGLRTVRTVRMSVVLGSGRKITTAKALHADELAAWQAAR